MAYAEDTSVPVERSRAQIEEMVRRHGADQFLSGWEALHARITFRVNGRYVRFDLEMPDPKDEAFTKRPGSSYLKRTAEAADKAHQQACRARWRALALVIKAKLEAVEAKISTFESEFLAHVVLPDNTLVGDRVRSAIDEAYRTGTMPALMAASTTEDA